MEPTTPRLEYSPHKRARIVSAFNSGMTGREVAEQEGVPPATAYGIRRRYRGQISAKSSPRSGRPPALSIRDKRRIFQLIHNDPFIKNEEILRQACLECSVDTLTRFLVKEGIQHKKALQRPKLTPELASERLEFARKYLRESPSFWRNWIFLDETTIERGKGERELWVHCRNVRLRRSCILADTNINRANGFFHSMYNLELSPQGIRRCSGPG